MEQKLKSSFFGMAGWGRTVVHVALAVLFAHALCAAEITFTGADASAPTDLSSPGNWDGGALPGSDDVGVVDVAVHGTSYTLAQDAQLGGLVITNGTSMPTIQSTHVLTLGAGGLTLIGTGGIYLKVSMGIACDQTWTCGKGPLRTYDTFTGTATLTITQAKGVGHHKAPRYGGTIVYSSITEWNNSNWSRPMQINLYERARWASMVAMPASTQIRLLFPGDTSFSTLFPDIASPADLPTLDLAIEPIQADESASGVAGSPNFSLLPGEVATVNSFHVGGGAMNHSAGATLRTPGMVVVGNDRYYNYAYTSACHYYLFGGTLDAGMIEVGAYGRGVTRFVHEDGEVTVTNRVVIGGGNQGRCENLAEYRLNQGYLTIVAESGNNDNGLDIYRPQAQMGYGSGMYEQYGGTCSVSRVMFGANDSAWSSTTPDTANGGAPKRCNDAYGLFEFNAGRFILGKGGFAAGRDWNWDRERYNLDGTNACYDARLLGGTLAASANFASTLALQLPRAGGSLEWDTGAYTNVIAAPVFGEGTLRKTGAGMLTLSDATAFKGSVEVGEGTLRLMGGGGTVSGDFWQWTADSAAATYADGASVSNWYDNVHGVLATNVTFRGKNQGKDVVSSYSVPTLVLNKFNGHAGLKFASSLLSVPADVNPLANVEKATIVLVMMPNFDGGGSPSSENTIYYSNYHMIGGGNGFYHGDYVPWFGLSSGNRLSMTVTCKVNGTFVTPFPYVGSPEGRNMKGSVHVIIGTMDKGKLSLMADGALSCTNMAPAGTETVSRYFVNSSGNALPLHFGAMMSDGGNFRTCSQMFLAEVRAYPERVLTVSEQCALTCELLTKYSDNDRVVKSLVDMPGNMDGEMVASVPEVVENVPTPTDLWTADSLAATLADGSPVTSWATETGSAIAVQPSGAGEPTFAAAAFGTHAGVCFESSRSTALATPFSDMTKRDPNNWAYSVVFRSRLATTGRSGADVGRGIASCTVGSASNSDFSLAVATNGMLVGRTAGANIAFQRPLHLDDGRPHVAVLSCNRSGTNKAYLMVDGMLNIIALERNPALANTSSFKLFFGKRPGTGYLEGDIAEFAWFGGGEALTVAQMEALSKDLAQKYGARLYDKDAYKLSDITAYGLGATNVAVAAGASLSLPIASTSPYTVGAGTTLSLEGSVTDGMLALANGATLKMRYGNAPIPSVAALRATGNVRLVISDLPQSHPSWIPLARVEGEADIDGAHWTVDGVRSAEVSVVEGVLGVFSRSGTILIFR